MVHPSTDTNDMKTTKTITIHGRRYTAASLRKIAAERGFQVSAGGDMLVELQPGVEICLTEYKPENEIGVRNYGGTQIKGKGFGDLVAILA